LLVIDEFHRLAGAAKTREFLGNRIAERVEAGRATAVASRHGPRAMRGISPRIASLFLGGFVLFTSHAGPAIRRRYLASISKGRLGRDPIERLCSATPGGLGALRAAWLASEGMPCGGGAVSVPVARIIAATARDFDVDPLELTGRSKRASLARAREALLWTAARLGVASGNLAGALDGRSRASIERALARARARAAADPNFLARVEALAARLVSESQRSRGGAPA
jgi:hypothetical protein